MVHVPHHLQRLFQDSISVTIPLDVTADMGVAMKRTRAKRIQKLHNQFPSLKKKETSPSETEAASAAAADSDDKDASASGDAAVAAPPPTSSTKKKKRGNMPQRHEYGNMLDYLEAKYTQGVMIDDSDKSSSSGDDDDDKRSVYSSGGSLSSFMDDSELKRDVAGQVMSQAIQTKIQAVGDEDDEFFVNVGNLEVEDADNLMDYDPLADTAAAKELEKKKKKKQQPQKRKRPSTDTATEKPSSAITTTKKPQKVGSSPATKKPKVSTTASSSNQQDAKKKEATPPEKTLTEKEQAQLKEYKVKATKQKVLMQDFHQKVVAAIRKMTKEDLPRKQTSTKVSLVVPHDKGPGEFVVFTNPHRPGQRLRATVPSGSGPGKKFAVNIPSPPPPEDSDNKFSRDFQDLLDDYSQAHDAWCQTRSHMATLTGATFSQHAERMNKFDSLLPEFPKNLVTPIDGSYMRKIVRRARQNKHKRKKTIQAKVEEGEDDHDGDNADAEKTFVRVPGKGTIFPQVEFKKSDFAKKKE